MQRVANPEMDRFILDHLASLYKLKDKREGIHLSSLVYCITRSFFDQVAPVEPTDEEVMLFALGLGLQDVLTPKEAIVPVYEKDGITFSPDFMLKLGDQGQFAEIKTTRMSLKKALESLPETWIEYIMGGCFIREVTRYELCGLFMLGSYAPPFPVIYSETLIFEPTELRDNWDYILGRKRVYEEALANNQPPQPFSYCKNWECSRCRYKLQCSAIQMITDKESEVTTHYTQTGNTSAGSI